MTNSVMEDVALKSGSGSLADFLDRIGLTGAARDRVIDIDQTLAAELEKSTIDHDRCSNLVIEVADLVSGPLRGWISILDDFDFNGMDLGAGGVEDEEVSDV